MSFTQVTSTNLNNDISVKLAAGEAAAAAVANIVSMAVKTIQIANSSYNVLDDTAANTGGGYLVITGTGFTSDCIVIVGTTNATSTTYVNSTTLRAQVPAASATTYNLYVVDTVTGATAIKVNGLTYSSFPAWSTGSSLSNQSNNTFFGVNLSANADSSITYSNTTSLPSGTTLAANGYFSGTMTVGTSTTYSFGIKATDAENQDTSRTFSLTITVDPVLFMGGSAGIPAGTTTSASSNIGDSRTAAKAFDNSIGEITECWHSGNSPGTVTFSITFNQQKQIDVYRIIPRVGNDWKPNTWDLQGSNDNSTWTTVDSRSDQASSIPSPAGQPLATVLATGNYAQWTVANPGLYSYYRFLFYGGSANYIVIGEIMFYSY